MKKSTNYFFSLLFLLICGWENTVQAQISGTVFNDVNGLTDNTVNGTGTSAGGLNAVLVNVTTGFVVGTVPVSATGSYSFATVASANYNVLLTTNTATIGSVPPAVALPTNWVSTGEFLGTGAGSDGTVNGILPLGTTASVTNANFGIEQLPTTNISTAIAITNPGGTLTAAIAATNFGATDPDGGVIDSIRIIVFPTNTTTLVVNTINYTTGNFPIAGIYVPTNATGQPTQAIAIDPIAGAVDVVISYAAIDNAAKEDATPGSLTVPFTNKIEGTVFNDVNGLLGTPINTVDGAGTNAGGLNVFAINTVTNLVAATTAVAANGTYSLTGLPNGSFGVWISTNTATIGSPVPTINLPTNWVSTGEFLGSGAGSDGTVDGKLNIGAVADNIINAKIGIEQLPTSVVYLAPSQPNPGGVISVLVPNNFGGTDPSGGYIDSLLILSFPTNTTTITINGTDYTSGTFPIGGIYVPTNNFGQPLVPLNVDPVDGNINVVITYRVIDNAGMLSHNEGTLTIPFNPGFTITDGSSAQELVEYLTGEGVVVLNPTMNGTCPLISRGKFNYYGNPSDVGIDSGIVLTSGRVVTVGGNIGINAPALSQASYGFPGGAPYAPGDAQLNALLAAAGSNSTTNDACVLEFDFVPSGDTIKFDYVFGSEEYPEYACSQFNDVFGFLITGPGYTGNTNIAKIPGTDIPVAINTINMAPNGTTYSIATCNGMGAGSPFGMYYVDNLGNANQRIVYDGFTTILTARAFVTPCDTFHLKIAIADAGDNSFDSGVFLKAGSLSSPTLVVKTLGGGGLEVPFTNTVRGCPPGVVRVSRSSGLSQPINIPIVLSGTAVNGLDYVTLPNSVFIPAGDSVATLFVHGIPLTPAVGPKSLIVSIISPYTCGNGDTVVLSSDTIMIYDSIYVKILNPDTSICRDRSVLLNIDADSTLDFVWSPAATVDNPTAMNVTVTPTAPTTYTVSVSLPGSLGTGCGASTASVFVDVKDTPQVNLGPDKVTCGDAVQLNALTTPLNPDESFEWTPVTGLSSSTIRNPISTPTSTIEYVVKVNPGAEGCDGFDTIKVTLLPDHIEVLNMDTVVCAGTVFPLRSFGDTSFSYNWTPEINVADPLAPNTFLTANTSGYYTLTASYPGCIDMPDSFYVEVQPIPNVNVGPDKIICTYDTIQLYASVTPANYPSYTYAWTPGSNMTDSTAQTPIFNGDASVPSLSVKVTTPIGCVGYDTLSVTVYPGDFLSVMPEDTGSCPPVRVQLEAVGADSYSWSPEYGLDDTEIANPIATPVSSNDYYVIGTKMYNTHACYDTQMVRFQVYPQATLTMPDSVQIWPGESYQIDPGGNCLYFQWFPPSGLSAANISNPIASPEVRTRYFVTASTEHGCELIDSIDILVNTESVLDVPNAFSPSSGEFKIVKRGIANLKYFRIFNRWGNKVFETTDINKGWDGTFNDKAQPVGVYIYSIDATTSTGKPFRRDGNVTLLR